MYYMRNVEIVILFTIIAVPSFFALYIAMRAGPLENVGDLKTDLSIMRTQMANTRTYLAFIRTGIMFSILTLGLYSNFKDKNPSIVLWGTAFAFIILSIGVFYWSKYKKFIDSASLLEAE